MSGLGTSFPEGWEQPISTRQVGPSGAGLQEAVYGSDRELNVRFYLQPIVNEAETERQNVKVIDYKEFVRIQRIGDRLSVYQGAATPSFIRRFPHQYQLFKEGKTAASGTTLEAWDYQLSETDILTFKTLGIYYVHQLAAMSVDQQNVLGLDAKKIVARAKIDCADKELKDQNGDLLLKLEQVQEEFRKQTEENAKLFQQLTEQKAAADEQERKRVARLIEASNGNDESAKALNTLDQILESKKAK